MLKQEWNPKSFIIATSVLKISKRYQLHFYVGVGNEPEGFVN